jgi:prevent-host-death family protein
MGGLGLRAGWGDSDKTVAGVANWGCALDSLTKRTNKRTLCVLEFTMTTLTASEARANLYRLIDETAASHQPIHIAGKRTSAVLVSADDWQAIQETLYLLSVPGMRESIKEGMAEPLADSAESLEW